MCLLCVNIGKMPAVEVHSLSLPLFLLPRLPLTRRSLANGQVQFLSVAGKIGGEEAKAERGDSLQLFSSGFEWANYKFSNFTLTGFIRGSSAARRRGEEVEGQESNQDCGIRPGEKGLDQLLPCVILLAVVAVLRGALCFVLRRLLQREIPPLLSFPAWEVRLPLSRLPLSDAAPLVPA